MTPIVRTFRLPVRNIKIFHLIVDRWGLKTLGGKDRGQGYHIRGYGFESLDLQDQPLHLEVGACYVPSCHRQWLM